jgi:diguanylate cyclase (GGDEF)-like protein
MACAVGSGAAVSPPSHAAEGQSAVPHQPAAGAAGATALLTSVAQIRALPASGAAASIPVELHAILTYYQPSEGQIFVQDATGGIYVVPPAHPSDLQPGDEVVVRGVTVPSFATNVKAASIEVVSKAQFPEPVAVDWRELLQRSTDCRYVSITGTVRSATHQQDTGQNSVARIRRREGAPDTSQQAQPEGDDSGYLLIDLQTDGGPLRVHMEDVGTLDPLSLLDADVKVEGVAGGIFDGKYQQTGAELWVSSAAHMQVVKKAAGNPASLPLTNIARIESHSYVQDRSDRLHVRGSVTLYEPGLQMVVENQDRQAALVNTYEQSPIRVGQVVDVVGFPYPHEYSEAIGQSNVLPTAAMNVIQPLAIQWDDAMAGHFPYELISMEGTLAAEVHERHQDTLVIQAGPHVFSAVLPRTVWNQDFDQLVLPEYSIGSKVRVTGVCFVHAGGPWNTERWFDLEMRSPQDLAVLAHPSWWTVRHLFYLSAALVALMLTALIWAIVLQKKVRHQSEQIRSTMETEAARERRIARLEEKRGRVLEAINSKLNLDEVLLMIVQLISGQLGDRACWCELPNAARVGMPAAEKGAAPTVRRDISSSAGERLGSLVLAGAHFRDAHVGEVMEMGASLAALAIDNRRLYETLMHRSHYDQLTNAANRFLLESRLDEVIGNADRNQTKFALIYIDLDQFKRVNDVYGHRVGDLFLRQAAQRFSYSLRGMDTLARVGGDEFIALIPVVRSRSEVEEIGQRLMRCLDTPLDIEGQPVSGSASIGIAIYPDDGPTKEDLKRVADAAMYLQKSRVAR